MERIKAIEDKINEILAALKSQSSPWLTVEQAAESIQTHLDFIRRRVLSGEIPAVNISTKANPRWRIARKDLDEWMKNRK